MWLPINRNAACNPAISGRSVAFRPSIAAGVADGGLAAVLVAFQLMHMIGFAFLIETTSVPTIVRVPFVAKLEL
jgi:hypothetical protein